MGRCGGRLGISPDAPRAPRSCCSRLALLAAPAWADGGADVPIYNAAYGAPHVDVLAGDTVTWHNDSVRAHTVKADDGSWTSPRLPRCRRSDRRFDAPGDRSPTTASCIRRCAATSACTACCSTRRASRRRPGKPYALPAARRCPPGSTVSIEADGARRRHGDGRRARRVHARPCTPSATTTYRAVAGGEAGPPVQVLVLDRKVSAAARSRKGGSRSTRAVTPASPGATVVLQLKLKERFGWWPVRTAKLGADSRVTFTLPRGRKVAARVLLTASDGATELARSATFRLR